MKRHRLAIASLVTLVGTAGAMAADAFTLPVSSLAEPALLAAPGEFDWNGFYAGVHGVAAMRDDQASLGAGLNVGVNAQFDFVLVGAEVAVQGLSEAEDPGLYGQVLGRAGLIMADNVAVYAAGGYGLDLTDGRGEPLLGGGVELALSEDVSLRAQYLRGFPEQPDGTFHQFTIGAQLQF